MTAGFANCGAVTRPEVAERVRGKKGLPWAGTYPQDPLPCAVALKQLEVIQRDDLVGHCERPGAVLEEKLEALRRRHPCIGDVRCIVAL